uniref:Uncharacterized protein n=1 Tax=Caulobacter phage BL57 TaxID=3348355 RepID=A0AB74ULJ3_9VIRU
MWWDPKDRAKAFGLGTAGKVYDPAHPMFGKPCWEVDEGFRLYSPLAAGTAKALLDRMWDIFDVYPILLRRADGSFRLDIDHYLASDREANQEMEAPDVVVSPRIAKALVEAGVLVVVEYTERGAWDRLEIGQVPK